MQLLLNLIDNFPPWHPIVFRWYSLPHTTTASSHMQQLLQPWQLYSPVSWQFRRPPLPAREMSIVEILSRIDYFVPPIPTSAVVCPHVTPPPHPPKTHTAVVHTHPPPHRPSPPSTAVMYSLTCETTCAVTVPRAGARTVTQNRFCVSHFASP